MGKRQLHTARLSMMQMGPEDVDVVAEYGRRCCASHAVWDPLRPVDWWETPVVEARLADEIDLAEQDRAVALYLTLHSAPRTVIGRIAMNNIVRGALQSCAVGYGLSPEATGQGLMTEALGAVVEMAFGELALHRVEANVIPRNLKSLAVVRRCGFREEGMSRHYIRIAGVWEDHMRFARTQEDR